MAAALLAAPCAGEWLMSTETLHGSLRYWAIRWPDRLAVRCGSRDLSWRELDASSDRIAAGLHAAGVRKGDRVGILMHNRIEFIETLFGVLKIGAALTLLNVRFTPREMIYPVIDAGLAVVITEPALADILGDATRELPVLKVFTTEPVDGCDTLAGLRGHGDSAPAVDVDSADIALVCYTSGTTGVPKGAMISHGNIRASGLARLIASGMTHRERLLVSLPLAYTGGMCNYLREALISGATTIIESSFDAERLMQVIEDEKISAWSVVPMLQERMMMHPRFGTADLSSLRHVVAAGAAVSPHLLQSWHRAGVPLTQGYGLTEASGGFVTILFADEAEHKLGSAGRAVMHTGLKILSGDRQPLSVGQTGDIWIAGPTVMQGYLNKPEETAEIRSGAWLQTGDMGLVDADGYLTMVDRSKDMLISGGLNVYPAELERVLADVPGLEEFAVIGIADERWGEVPMIVAHGSGALDLQMLRDRCRTELADYKRPRYLVHYGKPLPRTYSGKILKRQIRGEIAQLPADAVDLKQAMR